MKMVYIASPLRGDYDTNIKNAVEYCRIATEFGIMPMAPHIIFSQWCNDTIPEQREQGLKLGLELLSRADELWVMGNQISQGMHGEISYAIKHKIPIHQIEQPLDRDYYPISCDEQELLNGISCVDKSNEMNYENQVLVLKYDVLKPEYRNPANQLWNCQGGFGASPTARGRQVYVTNVFDGEQTSFYRQDFVGIVKPEVLERISPLYARNMEPIVEEGMER